ncbi:hypothetical protein RQP46_007599 [Phenoliferia psychrophenolica]
MRYKAVGDLRFRRPTSPINITSTGIMDSSAAGNKCIGMQTTDGLVQGTDAPSQLYDEVIQSFPQANGTMDEDCLNLVVIAPTVLPTTGSGLPVVLYLFAGGFETGSNQDVNGAVAVNRSIEIGTPVIWVAVNYRLNIFGFLAGSEVKDGGVANLGLWDQRFGMEWVNKHISSFGGDPNKVTLMGFIAGSGSVLPVGSMLHGQGTYDDMVSLTNCTTAPDTLQCLREVPIHTLQKAMDTTPGDLSYQGLNLTWQPRVDGDFFSANPYDLVAAGKTEFVIVASQTLTTGDEAMQFIRTNYMPLMSDAELAHLAVLYPEGELQTTRLGEALTDPCDTTDPTAGSPFNTSYANILNPHALDGVFGLANAQTAESMNWDFMDYVLNFIVSMDPNIGPTASNNIHWPQYLVNTSAPPQMMALVDLNTDLPVGAAATLNKEIVTDDFRAAQMSYIQMLWQKYPM